MFENRKFGESAGCIVNLCRNLLGAAGGCMSLLDKDGKQDEVVFSSLGRSPFESSLRLPVAIRRLKEEAQRSSTTVYGNDIAGKKSRQPSPGDGVTFGNVLFAPLTFDGKTAGWLCLVDKQGGFDAGDARTASAFAEIASMILERNRTLEALRLSEERFRLIAQKAADAVISVDDRGRIVFWNDAAVAMFGYSAEEVRGKPVRLIMPRRFRDKHRRAFQRAITTGESFIIGKAVEMAGLKKNGSEFPVELSMAAWRTEGQTVFTGILRDITERKDAERALQKTQAELEKRVREKTDELIVGNEQLQREMEKRNKAEEALRESETKYRIVAENTFDWEWWLGRDGRFIYVSPSCKRITGHEPEEFVSAPGLIFEIIHPDDRAIFIEHRSEVDRTLRGGELEFRVVRPDGTQRWVAHVCQPAFDEAGRFLGHRGSNRDVTERREAEEALRQSEQTLRFLSSQLLTVQEKERRRVAREVHDGISQTLTAVKFALESKLDQMGKDKTPPGISLENIISLVQQGIEEARRIQMDLRPAILDDLGILATLSWFSREFQNVYQDIQVVRTFEIAEKDLRGVLRIVIFRIVQEALNNVAKHGRASLVHISLRRVHRSVELTIEDNGRGFDLGKVDRGFGLVSMRERAEFSGGSFEIKSTPGKGTMVKAVWPT